MNKRIPIALVLVAVAALVYFKVYRANGAAGDFLASGTVEATEAALGFQVPGRIARIGPHEGDQVKSGDELAVLDRDELEARRTQAQWQLAGARALLAEIEAGSRSEETAQAREAARSAGERVADAQRDLERAQRLVQGGAISQEAFDKAKLALDVATAQRNQADEQLKLVEKGPRSRAA